MNKQGALLSAAQAQTPAIASSYTYPPGLKHYIVYDLTGCVAPEQPPGLIGN
jgi:hypothetical protein